MKRRWWVAGVIVLLIGSFTWWYWRNLRIALMYQSYETGPKLYHVYYKKRVEWFPGPEVTTNDKICWHCKEGLHGDCEVGWRLHWAGFAQEKFADIRSVRYHGGAPEAYCICSICPPERAK